MAASPSPEGENASISDESDGGGGKSGEIIGNGAERAVEERRPEGRNIGENYETTADIDLQLLEELGMIVDLKFIVGGICDSRVWKSSCLLDRCGGVGGEGSITLLVY